MTKIMSAEIKEASVGEFIVAEDLLSSPIKLKIVGSELKRDSVIAKESGKAMDKIIFFFENNKGEGKEIGVLSFDSLVRAMNAVDPDVGDILQLETMEVVGARYLVWKVELVKKGDGKTLAKKVATGEVKADKLPAETTGPVKKDDSEEEIKIEDIPF